MNKSAKEFIGNPDYPAISYGGYRGKSREDQPTIEEIKEDLYIMHAQGFRVFRTYDLHHPFAENTLKALIINGNLKTTKMSNSAIITMVSTQVFVTLVTAYFFFKVLKKPSKGD